MTGSSRLVPADLGKLITYFLLQIVSSSIGELGSGRQEKPDKLSVVSFSLDMFECLEIRSDTQIIIQLLDLCICLEVIGVFLSKVKCP